MKDKIEVKCKLLVFLNRNGMRYSMKDIHKVLNHFSKRLYESNISPLWFLSYNQGYFGIALEEF